MSAARTLIVAPDGQGEFSAVQPALDAARPGDTVLVRAGTYVADLWLRQGVTLRGAGAERTRLVAAREKALVAQNITEALIREVTLDGAGKDNQCTVWLDSATVTMEACVVTGAKLSGIEATQGAVLTLRGSTIRDNGAGVYIHDEAEGVLEANVLLANSLSGLEVKSRGRVTARGNTCRDNGAGVLIWEEAEGALEANILVANGLHGVEVRERGQATLHANTIVRNTECCIWVHKEARAHLRHNIIAYNTTRGVRSQGNPGEADAAELTLSRNCLWNNYPNYLSNLDPSTDLLADPYFVDPDHGDYHLQPTSPCIGAGLDGSDLGAYPYQPPAPRRPRRRPDARVLPHLRTWPLAHSTPPTPERPVAWLRSAGACAVSMPLILAQDLGSLLAQPGAEEALARPAYLPDDLDTAPYLAFLRRIASQAVLRAVRTWHLSDAVIGAILARLVTGVSFPPAYVVPSGASGVAWADNLSTCLRSSTPASLWQATPVAQRPSLDTLLPPAAMAQIASNLQQLDLPSLRFLHQYGPRLSSNADPLALYDLRALLDLPPLPRLAVTQGMHLLPRVSDSVQGHGGMQTYAMGGYNGLMQRGNLDSLLPSELAYPPEMLAHRLLNHEALYYGRDSEREPQRALAYIVTQQGLELLGDGDVLARAITLALAHTLQRRGYDVQHSFVGSRWTRPERLDRPGDVHRLLYYRDDDMLDAHAMLTAVHEQLRAWQAPYRERYVFWVVSEHWDADTWFAHRALYHALRQLATQQA